MKKTDVDKIDLDKPIKAYMAKPDKTLGEHYEDFLRQAEIEVKDEEGLIESDWNLKMLPNSDYATRRPRINRIRLEFKAL